MVCFLSAFLAEHETDTYAAFPYIVGFVPALGKSVHAVARKVSDTTVNADTYTAGKTVSCLNVSACTQMPFRIFLAYFFSAVKGGQGGFRANGCQQGRHLHAPPALTGGREKTKHIGIELQTVALRRHTAFQTGVVPAFHSEYRSMITDTVRTKPVIAGDAAISLAHAHFPENSQSLQRKYRIETVASINSAAESRTGLVETETAELAHTEGYATLQTHIPAGKFGIFRSILGHERSCTEQDAE